ncbi:MAG: hypothetical protein H6R26_2119, partial [Proteobacteria bacterium]|nr:hypothetical protein [Pseudomonadota bacterium]
MMYKKILLVAIALFGVAACAKQ